MDTFSKGVLIIVLLLFVAIFVIVWSYKIWQHQKEVIDSQILEESKKR